MENSKLNGGDSSSSHREAKFKMENVVQTNENEMTERQCDYIRDLLVNQRIDEKYRRYVERALQNEVTRSQASKIIDFLIKFIVFKENFVGTRNGSNNNDFRSGNKYSKESDNDGSCSDQSK